MCNAIRVVWAGNDAPSNPYHEYVDMLIEIKRWKHSIFTSFITSFHVCIKIMLCGIEAWSK